MKVKNLISLKNIQFNIIKIYDKYLLDEDNIYDSNYKKKINSLSEYDAYKKRFPDEKTENIIENNDNKENAYVLLSYFNK